LKKILDDGLSRLDLDREQPLAEVHYQIDLVSAGIAPEIEVRLPAAIVVIRRGGLEERS